MALHEGLTHSKRTEQFQFVYSVTERIDALLDAVRDQEPSQYKHFHTNKGLFTEGFSTELTDPEKDDVRVRVTIGPSDRDESIEYVVHAVATSKTDPDKIAETYYVYPQVVRYVMFQRQGNYTFKSDRYLTRSHEDATSRSHLQDLLRDVEKKHNAALLHRRKE